jgi:tripartite-type tricarboxylate transporter receptor subunit TctC
MNQRFRTSIAAMLAAIFMIAASHGAAQSAVGAEVTGYPIKPIRMIVSSGAGGGLDFVSRLVATQQL